MPWNGWEEQDLSTSPLITKTRVITYTYDCQTTRPIDSGAGRQYSVDVRWADPQGHRRWELTDGRVGRGDGAV